MIARHNAALAAANSCKGTLEDSPEEVELHAAVEAFVDSPAKLTSYAGVLDALRLAAKENEDFTGSEITVTLVKGVLAFLEARENELPVDRVERLAVELSETLPNWANGQFMAMIYPAGDERGYWFRNARHEGNKPVDPIVRLREITGEATMLLATNPQMMIDHVTAFKHGVYTVLDIPGVASAPQDPLLETIQRFRKELATFSAIPEDKITPANEEGLVEETYGPWMEKLDDWDEPARSVEGAIEAIKHMQNQEVFCDVAGKSMANAVLAFLEGVRA